MGMNHEVRVGPRRITLQDYDSNPHGSQCSSDYSIAEFLARRDLRENVRLHYSPSLGEVIAKACEYASRVTSIDSAIGALPIDRRLAAYARDPRVQSGYARRVVTTDGLVFAYSPRELTVVDAQGTVIERCAYPFDGEILSISEVYCLDDVVFVGQSWLENQAHPDSGFLRYERGRGWTARCPLSG
jgi:hypothetical protein